MCLFNITLNRVKVSGAHVPLGPTVNTPLAPAVNTPLAPAVLVTQFQCCI